MKAAFLAGFGACLCFGLSVAIGIDAQHGYAALFGSITVLLIFTAAIAAARE